MMGKEGGEIRGVTREPVLNSCAKCSSSSNNSNTDRNEIVKKHQ